MINSSSVIISPVPCLSNSQYLALSFNRCTNCTIESSRCCLFSRNFVLSAMTHLFFSPFYYLAISLKVSSSRFLLLVCLLVSLPWPDPQSILSVFPHTQDRRVWSVILLATPLLCLGNRLSSLVISGVLFAYHASIYIIKTPENCWIKDHFNPRYNQRETDVFQLVSLFGQISAEKLQNRLFKIIWLHRL